MLLFLAVPPGHQRACPQRGVLWPHFSPDSIVEWTVLKQVLASHWDCVARTVICLNNFEPTVHISIHPVMCCSQSNQDDLVCSVQAVVAICWVEVRTLLMPFSCYENGGLHIFIGDRLVVLVKATSLFLQGCQLTGLHGLRKNSPECYLHLSIQLEQDTCEIF